MITAQQALEMANESKKGLEYVYENIEIMARLGNRYSCIKTYRIANPEQVAEKLRQDGFTVEVDGFFSVRW